MKQITAGSLAGRVKRKYSGFTLLEVMIVVAIVGILASVAYPSYVAFVMKSNRAEALRELSLIANLQEQFFVDTRAYTTDISLLGLGASASFTTETGNYVISSVVVPANNTFTLTAEAKKVQVNDTNCLLINITDTGQKTPVDCWEQ